MKYNRYEIGPYNLHVINTDKFKKNVINVSFKEKVKKENLTIRNFLAAILLKATKSYPDERSMAIKSEELYNIVYDSSSTIYGNYSIMNFEITFLDTKYTSTELLKDSVEFLTEIIFNPNVKDNQFDEKIFEMTKEELKLDIEAINENPQKKASKLLFENMDKSAPFAYLADGYIEDLDNITNKELYDYYKNVLKSNLVDIFVIGNNLDNIKELIINNFKINTIKKPATNYYLVHNKFRKRVKTVKEKEAINQSVLKIGFKFDNLTEFERKYVLNIYNYILSGGPDSKLFKNVREKNSLCYNVKSNISKIFNLMIITAGIDAKNYKKTVSLIKKELKNMEKGDFSEEEINSAKAVYNSSILSMQDSPYNLIGVYKAKEYLNLDPIEVRIEEIKKVSKEDIVKLSKKIKMDTIFLLEGECDE